MNPTFTDKLKMDVSELWKNYRGFLIVFSVLILIYKFRDIIIDVLVSSAKLTMDKAEKQDGKLKQQEDAANKQANELINQANKLDDNKPKVDEDWNKK